MIPYGKQSISEDDIEAVVEVLRSDFLTCGPKVEEFETAFAEMCGARYAVACSNGTAALHLAMMAAGLRPGDRVSTTPITFLASANAARYVGAEVDFHDIEPVAATLDAEALEKNWVDGTRAVVSVDYAGHPADLVRLAAIARERGAILIEDACHAIGGEIRFGQSTHRIGGFPWVDMATFSFHPVKTITTGEGGMIVTDRAEFAERARTLRSHGMIRSTDSFEAFGTAGLLQETGPWAYEMQDLGYNYRLTDLQCALGISQLRKLDGFVQRRAEIRGRYLEELSGLPNLVLPKMGQWLGSDSRISWHLFVLRIDFAKLGKSRTEVMAQLASHGVGSQVHYIPVSHQPYYEARRVQSAMPHAERFYGEAVSIPLSPSMTDEDIDIVIESVHEVCA